MLGIIITILAVLVVICFAFCFADSPSGRRFKNDSLFYLAPEQMKSKSSRIGTKARPRP